MKLCDYGCGQKAKYQFKNDKWCCSKNHISCPITRKKVSNNTKGKNNPRYGITCSDEIKEKIRASLKGKMKKDKNPFYKKKHTKKSRNAMSKSLRFTIDDYERKYPFFSQIEEMRYNPYKSGEIQVHCKNNLCKNSKENNGWFTPTYIQFYERIRALEKPSGMIENNFYCSKKCKVECPIYRKKSDNNKDILYTQEEYEIFKNHVLERDNYECQYCGKKAIDVHHERPQKLESFFVLDPDFAWSCCEKCHYKYGHKTGTECSTGNLASKVCI
ncbi:MAG: NUMOD3 domain-containing DNA-binding protein [Candidatus Thorarchaeota archaeon]